MIPKKFILDSTIVCFAPIRMEEQFRVAAQNGNVSEMTKIVNSVQRDSTFANHAISWAIQYGHDEIVLLILENHYWQMDEALSEAVRYGNNKLVRTLLSLNADVNPPLRSEHHNTPLMDAQDPDTVRILLQHKALVDAPDGDGLQNAAILHAAETGNVRKVRLLIEAKADLHACDWGGKPEGPFQRAARNGYIAVIALLLHHKADVNVHDRYGATVLYKACKHHQLAAVEYYLQNGADVASMRLEFVAEYLNVFLDTGASALITNTARCARLGSRILRALSQFGSVSKFLQTERFEYIETSILATIESLIDNECRALSRLILVYI